MTGVGRRVTASGAAWLGGGAAVAVGAWWRWRPFRVRVVGRSMEPALREGDVVVAVRPGPSRRGDVVVVRHPFRPALLVVKRVTGLGGEQFAGLRVDRGDVWVQGDRPGSSTDSRTWGPISTRAIVGRAVIRVGSGGPSVVRRSGRVDRGGS